MFEVIPEFEIEAEPRVCTLADYKGAEASVPITRLNAQIPLADLYADAFDLA